MSATNHLIEINPNNVTPSLQQPALGGQPLQQQVTPQQAWQDTISKLPLSYYMAIIDGFHDFCKGGRVAGNVSDDDDGVSDDISDIVKKAYFRQAEKLLRVQLKGSAAQTQTENINDMIAAMTNGKVGSVSNYERRTVKAIESRSDLAPVLGQTRKNYSIQEIVNAPNSDGSQNEDGKSGRPQLWKDICGEVINEINVADRNAAIAAGPALYDKSLYLYWDPEYTAPASGFWREGTGGHKPLTQGYQAYDPIFLKRLGSFIYTYLYPELSWSDGDRNKTAIVFDMASGCLGKIFGAFDNGFVTSDICPQTVSDSAGTSENQIKSIKKGSLNRYNFCETDSPENKISDTEAIEATLSGNFEGKIVYKAQSNVLTWKYKTDNNKIIHTRIIYAIDSSDEYTQSTYCYFKVYICTRIQEVDQTLKPWQLNELSFNIAEKNGPSVAYLSSLVYALENPGTALPNPPLKKAMINITPVIKSMAGKYPPDFLQALLFDFKRCGDWEQSRSAQLQNSSKVQLQKDNYQRVLFGTGDILCVTYNRECRGNSMWHYEGPGGAVGWNIELYRNPNITSKLNKSIADALEVVRKSTTIEKMLDRICHSSEFMGRVQSMKSLVGEHGHKAVYYYKGNKPANENKIESRIEKLITMICRIGMKDIYYKCEVFERLLASPNNILTRIVGDNIPGGDVCTTITNYYLMGLNYLRDIFNGMNVKSEDAAIKFLMFVKAPFGSKTDEENGEENAKYFQFPKSYFTETDQEDDENVEMQDANETVNTLIPPLSQVNDEKFEDIINLKAVGDDLKGKLLSAADENTGIVAIIIAKRIIFNNNYDGNDDDKFNEFLAIYEWLFAAYQQQQSNSLSINDLVTNYANSINGANPESDLKKALDLIKDIKTTTKEKILPAPGVQALSAVESSGYKKTTLRHVLQLGEADPIFRQKNAQGEEFGPYIFNKAFGSKSSLGAFKFRIKDMKKLADYLKLMYYTGFKIRARFGTMSGESRNLPNVEGQQLYKPTDNWITFSNMVKQTMPGPDGQQPQRYIGWTQGQVQGNGFRNYVSREVESAWPKLRKHNEDSEYGKILEDFTDFDCPALYRIVRDGTIVRSYVMTSPNDVTAYCNTIYCDANKPIVEGLNISRLAREKYNLDQNGLTPLQKVNIVAEEIDSFSRWLTILLDIQNDGNGLSPFSVNNLQQRANFLKALTVDIAGKAKVNNESAIDLINEMGGLDEFEGVDNISKFENMMYIAVNSIGYVNTVLPQVPINDNDLGGGGKKLQKGGALSMAEQKEIQLKMLSYLFLNMSGKARALISPLTDPRQLLVILNNIPQSVQSLPQYNQWLIGLRSRVQAEVTAMNPQQPLPRPNSKLILEILSLYSHMIYIKEYSGEDFDFLGTYKVFENIKYNFTASINSEMSPLTDEQGNPYDGYQFKLLDAVLKIFIMINNLHVMVPSQGETIGPAADPPTIPGMKKRTDRDEAEEPVESDDGATPATTKRSRRKVVLSRNQGGGGMRSFDSIKNNEELLNGLNNSIISENETAEINYYFPNTDIYKGWNEKIANDIGFNIQAQPQGNIQAEIIRKLLYLILKSKIESGPLPGQQSPPAANVAPELIRRELDEILKFTIPYSQSIMPGPGYQYFILPHIKLLLAFSAIQSLLPATTAEREKDPLFMLFFQNPSALPSGKGIDFAWTKWQDNTIINSIYQILHQLLLFQENGNYQPFRTGGVFMGGKKSKTRKKRKKKRKTRKAKKKRQNKKKKTRVKRDKRGKRKTRSRKKNN